MFHVPPPKRVVFNVQAIMDCAWREFRQSRAVGSKPELPFSYYLKRAWNGARAERIWWLDGMTAKGGTIFCIFLEG
jgi:hypothetical protein